MQMTNYSGFHADYSWLMTDSDKKFVSLGWMSIFVPPFQNLKFLKKTVWSKRNVREHWEKSEGRHLHTCTNGNIWTESLRSAQQITRTWSLSPTCIHIPAYWTEFTCSVHPDDRIGWIGKIKIPFVVPGYLERIHITGWFSRLRTDCRDKPGWFNFPDKMIASIVT